MPSFGQKLKQEREKRNISLEQISVSTKIGIRMLQALEEDKFNQLPGGIFNKGFVRAYSRFLGLDEDQTIADYMQASGDALPVSTETATRADGSRENAADESATREKKDKVSRLNASADAAEAKDAKTLFNEGFNLVLNGKSEQGLRMMEDALRQGIAGRRPDHARLQLAYAYHLAGQDQKAVQIFRTVQGADGAAALARAWAIRLARAS